MAPLIVAILIVAGAIAWWHPWNRGSGGGTSGQPDARQAGRRGGASAMNQTQPVHVASVTQGEMPVVINSLGTVTPLANVTVKTQLNGTLVDVAFGAGKFVGVGLHGLRSVTEDGVAWPHRFAGEEGEHINSVIWTGDRFVAVGQGATYVSPDGLEWTRTENKDAPLIAAFGAGVFAGTNWKGRILMSKDAVEWKQVYKAEHHLEAIAFG